MPSTGSRTGATRRRTCTRSCRSRWPCRPGPPTSPSSCGWPAPIACPSYRAAPGPGLSGGAAGIAGALTIVFTKMDAILEIDHANLVAVVQPGILNADVQGRGRGGGAVLRSGPGELRDLLDRRQPRDERRRPVLREVRPDPRLRPRPGGRAGRRDRHPDRRPERQGRRRICPDPPVRGVAGDARPHHGSHPSPPPDAVTARHAARVLPDPRECRPGGQRDHRGRDRAGDPRAHGPARRSRRWTTGIISASIGTPPRCCS